MQSTSRAATRIESADDILNTGASVWPMLLALIAVAAMSQAFRTMAAVVAPGVQSEFGLSAKEVGLFAGAFHLSFALMQIPVGLALDLYGIKRTVGVTFACALAGTLLAAFAPNLPLLICGQALIGFGCAPAFVGALLFVSRYFAEGRFASVSGLVLSLSGLGLLATGTPLAWIVETWSWRAGFLATALAAAVILLTMLALVRERPSERRADPRRAFIEVGAILKARHTLGILALALVGYSSYLALRGLWAVPMLMERYGFTLTQAGNVLLASSVAALIGPPIFGLLGGDARQRRYWLGGSVVLLALAFAALALSSGWLVDTALCIVFGFLTGFAVLQYADVRAAYAPEAVGRAFGIFNTAAFLGVALMQWGTGQVASIAAASGVDPFLAVFSFIAVTSALGVLAFFLLPWPPAIGDRNGRSTP